MVHNDVDIDQFILLTIYPAVVLFIITLIGRKIRIRTTIQYLIQALICITFAVTYLILIPKGGAQGLAIVLILFSGILLLMSRRHKIHPDEN